MKFYTPRVFAGCVILGDMMAFFFGGLGLIIGSFLNVVILRQGTGRSISGRSGCFSCGYQLQWYDLIPVVSWLMLRGKCRSCQSSISVQYPLVEVCTAGLFACIGGAPFVSGGMVQLLLLCVCAALLMCIAVYDLRHTIIPDVWVYAFIFCAFVNATVFAYPATQNEAVMVYSAGVLTAVPLFLFWFFSQGRAMGFGDVKLSVGIGYLVGLWHGLAAIMLAFIIGGVLCAPLLVFSSAWWRRICSTFTHRYGVKFPIMSVTMKSEVPFGPFLVCATCVVWMCQLYGIPLPWLFL